MSCWWWLSRVSFKDLFSRLSNNYIHREEITVDQPIQKISHKIGLSIVDPAGKQSVTKFKKISFNGKTSLVHCFPRTGRMHQIRVHLQYLGFPIANDPLYNSFAYGPEKGKGGNYGKSKEEVIRITMRFISSCTYVTFCIFSARGSIDYRTQRRKLGRNRRIQVGDSRQIGLWFVSWRSPPERNWRQKVWNSRSFAQA